MATRELILAFHLQTHVFVKFFLLLCTPTRLLMLPMFLRSLFLRLYPPPPTRLGRWCGPWSPVYARTCDPMRKGALADADNSFGRLVARKAENERAREDGREGMDPVSRLLWTQ